MGVKILRLLWLQILIALFLEAVCLSDLQTIVYGFLLSKRNDKTARKIHQQQSKKDRFTLSYIKNHTIYPKQFRRFYKLRLFYIYSLVPQYILIGVTVFCFNILWIANLIIFSKIVIFSLIGMLFIYNKRSIYDRQNDKKRKH